MKHSEELLLLIDEKSDVAVQNSDNQRHLNSFYWHPMPDRTEYVKRIPGGQVIVYGGGTGSALRSLLRRMLIAEVWNSDIFMGYVITESGRLLAQTLA